MNLAALCQGEPVPFKPGVYREMPRLIYDRIPALSCSALKKWLSLGELPSEFAYWMQTRWEETPSEAMLLGSALDCQLLDGDFSKRFAVAPAVDRRTTAGKAQWAAFVSANKGKTVLTAAQAEKVEAMSASISKAPALDGVFENCKKVVLCGELWGFPCKAEIDLFTPNSEHLLDLKTARDVSARWFSKTFLDLGYDCQASFYLSLAQACGIGKRTFDFLAVKNEPPWTCKVHVFDIDDPDHRILFDACQVKLARAAGSITTRLERNNFTDPQDWELLQLPEWALHQAKMETLAIA
jgi:PDDEXK-like domain of unknown function (DUF3799)